jgi:hypothetical protein
MAASLDKVVSPDKNGMLRTQAPRFCQMPAISIAGYLFWGNLRFRSIVARKRLIGATRNLSF